VEDTAKRLKAGKGGEIFLDADSALYSTCRRQPITIEST
jgi:hypothetical protein